MNLPKTRTIFGITCLAVTLTISAQAQDVVTIAPGLAQAHLIHKVEAQYPADAQAAQVQGTVVLRLSIDTTGHVTDAEVSSGPQLLQQAAVDAVRQWAYKPFVVGGKALAAAAEVNVVFILPASAGQTPSTDAPAAAAVTTPEAVPPPPPADSNSTFGSATAPATAEPTARPAAVPNAGFDSATPDTPPPPPPPPTETPAPPPAATASAGFESATPSDAAPPPPPPAAATGRPPVTTNAGFESATPSPDAAPAAAAAAPPPPAASNSAMESAAPLEAAPAEITPTVGVSSGAGSLAPTPENFGPLSEQCHKMMAARADVNALVTICGAMASAADNLPSDSRYVERRAAYVFDAAALLRAWRYPEAEAMAARAVALVEEGHDDFTGASAAYAVLGNAQALNGKLAQADKNLENAEALERKALQAATSQQQQVYSTTLRTILLFHAETLDRMGNKPAADAKRAEAAALLPVAS